MRLIQYKASAGNFGDELNADLWAALAPSLFEGDESEAFAGIGTIIGMKKIDDFRRINVFSSGVGYDPISNWSRFEVEYWCVRGPLSAELLGLSEDAAITDGAVLVPLVAGFPAKAEAGTRGVVVPHWESIEHGGWERVAELADLDLIDPRGTPRSVIGRIARAGYVLTESLHGAIIAEIYGVPWAAFALSGNFSVFKWLDWTMTVGRELRLNIVPPPDAGLHLKFGRRPEPAGSSVLFLPEHAHGTFEERVALPVKTSAVKSFAKTVVGRVKPLQTLLGYGEERTAQALTALKSRAEVTPVSRVPELQERMSERLDAFVRRHRG